MKTKTIRYFDSWIKQRNNIIIVYNEPYFGDRACKQYFKLKDGVLYELKSKLL